MNLNDIPLFAMLKGKLAYVSQRQSVIAQNVANADTPGFAPKDLKAFSFDQALKSAQGATGIGVVRTNAAHLKTDAAGDEPWGDQNSPDSEVRLDGNHVVLEEQMMKLTQAKMDYDAAVGFYQQSLQLLQTAIKKPGS
jgi:flagellar basal-body rod protein FlgB